MKKTFLGLGLGLATILASCATTSTWTPATVAPRTTEAFDFTGALLQAADKTPLQSYTWAPKSAPKAVVVIVHGIKDHVQRYEPLAVALTTAGVAVIGADLRGHGYSGGDRQRFDSVDGLVGDVEVVVRQAKATWPGLPVFFYGHSLGGLITATYAQKSTESIKGFVLSAPSLKLQPSVSGVTITLAKVVAFVAPGANVQKVEEREFVQDEATFQAMQKDPLISHEALPARSAVAAVDAIDALGKNYGSNKPFLILHGTSDIVTNQVASREYFDKSTSSDKSYLPVDGAWHDLLHEPQANKVIQKVVEWVTTHLQA